jgi:hypothetical protein
VVTAAGAAGAVELVDVDTEEDGAVAGLVDIDVVGDTAGSPVLVMAGET